MFIWFLIFIIILGIAFLLTLYLYDNNPFKKITGYSFFQTMFNHKIRAVYKLYRILNSVHKKGKVLLNVKLPNSNKVIDAVYVHPSGVYVIDVKNLNGWLSGEEKSAEWILIQYKEKVHTFSNPLIQSVKMTKALQSFVSINKTNIFHTMLAFSDNTVFKKVSIQSKSIHVKNISDLKEFLTEQSEALLTDNEIENIYKSLESFMTFPKEKTKMENAISN